MRIPTILDPSGSRQCPLLPILLKDSFSTDREKFQSSPQPSLVLALDKPI